ncbi:MAG: DNA polymerase III subunit gamma/tau [Cyanobacteria bacterium J06600_6]
MAYEPLHHKYRPQTFGDLVGQETIALTLSNALNQARIAPAYLFTGPRGTGKTSSARILAKSLNCLASDRPTPHPCGKCEACLAIAKGSALDVMEIDAASNTGVDNIREIIERSRFAPVQCRYKIYAIDECLAGDSFIKTDEGRMRIDNPNLKGKQVVSYNENTGRWEKKKVLRWLERGVKETLIVTASLYSGSRKIASTQIRCTANHLIWTDRGWIEAKNLEPGVNVMLSQTLESYPAQYSGELIQVDSITEGESEPVYDLEVEDNHNFVANGLLVHNCHMLSTAAFNALLKTLEEPPPQVVFILATTDPQRVLSTIISRCQRFDYRRIPLAEMTSHLRYIADAEQIAIADDALTLVAQISNGGLRDAESLLDQLSLLPETITVEKVWDLVGAVPEQDLLKLLQAINSNDSIAVLQQCRSLLDRGREPLVVLQNLATFYLNLLIAKTAPHNSELTAVTETCWKQLCEAGKNWQTALILRGQQHLKDAETQLKRTTQPRLWLEVTLLGLLPEVHNSIIANPQTVVPTSPQQIVTPLPTVVIAPPAPPQNTPAQNTQAVPSIPVETNHLSPASPTQPANSAPTVTQSPSPQVEQNFEPQQTAAQTPEFVAPAPVAPVAPSANQDPAANQQTWSQVVSCLQPPTTQALLKQQCHLLSFDGMSAIVAVNSAKLEKMAQQKIPNIEAAFAQVCQRKVRVQLEIASAKKNPNNNVSNSAVKPQQPPWSTPAAIPAQPSEPLSPPASTAQPRENTTIPTNSTPKQVPAPPAKPFNYDDQSADRSQTVNRQNSSTIDSSTNPIKHASDNIAVANPSPHSEPNLDRDYADSDLQQAIDSLTQSFEGEVVQMGKDINDDLEDEDDSESLETVVNSETTAPLERPDVEDYDDDW